MNGVYQVRLQGTNLFVAYLLDRARNLVYNGGLQVMYDCHKFSLISRNGVGPAITEGRANVCQASNGNMGRKDTGSRSRWKKSAFLKLEDHR